MPLSAEFIHILIKSMKRKRERKKQNCCVYFIIYSEIEYESDFSSKNFEQENQSSKTFRQVSVINNKETDELISPLHRSNYALDFRHSNNESPSKKSIEQNIKGFIDTCVRSSIHDISHVNREVDSKCIFVFFKVIFFLFI